MAAQEDVEQLMLDVGQANELKLAARRCGYNNTDLKRLSEGRMMARILPVLRSQADVRVVLRPIDLDSHPFIPRESLYGRTLTVEYHQKGGKFEWREDRVGLYILPDQKGRNRVHGSRLRDLHPPKLSVANANLLDYLLKYPHLIPDAWKDKWKVGNEIRRIYFWGTIYRDAYGERYVRYLYFSEDRWQADLSDPDGYYGSKDPAVLLAA